MSKKENPENKIDVNHVPAWILSFKNIALVVIGLLTAWNTYTADKTKTALEIQSSKLDQEIKQKEFENQLRFKIFDEVKAAVVKPDSNLQEVVRVMVEQVLVDDSTFQEKMKTVLLASRNTSELIVADMKNTEEFQVEEQQVQQQVMQQAQINLKGPSDDVVAQTAPKEIYRIDVFFLEDLLFESETRAKKVRDVLSKQFTNYDIRLRRLPRSINAREGYRIDGNQIRCEDDEKILAEKIRTVIIKAGIFEKEAPKLYPVGNKTPNYLSVFVRNM